MSTKKKESKIEIKQSKEDKEYVKRILNERKDIRCECKAQKKNENDRIKYGTCRCDSYSLNTTLGNVIANSLFQYIAIASQIIERDDFDIIEKHARAIREYSNADIWDKYIIKKENAEDELTPNYAYELKERAWREAIFWLQENWPSLWW